MSAKRAPWRTPAQLSKFVVPALVRLAVGALGLVLFVVFVTPVQAARDQDVLHDEMRAEIADPSEIPETIEPGTPIAELDIPSLDLERQVVVQGTTSADLTSGIGHRRDSVLPGHAGLSVLYGRSTAYGGPFGDLEDLEPGDMIRFATPDGDFGYRVDGVRYDGDPIPARQPGGTWLMLVTADGDPFRPTESMYVDATLVDGTPFEPYAVEAVTGDEAAMAGDPGGWFSMVMWLQGLGAVLIAMAWVRHRIGRRETLIMGSPVVVAVMWNVYESALRLLPNLL